MVKEKDNEKDQTKSERKMFVGVVWNCAAELKLLLTALLFICSIITVFQFLPSRLSFSVSDLRNCVSENNIPTIKSAAVVAEEISPPPPPPPPPLQSPPPPQLKNQDVVLDGGIIKRAFNPYGAAPYNFILMSAYRGGLNTFSINALASKPLHVFGKPTYLCEWVPDSSNATAMESKNVTTDGYKILVDWGYGHIYTVVIINCTFPVPVGDPTSGGKLLVHASTNGAGDTNLNITDTIEALSEAPGNLNPSIFTSPPKLDYLYCGSSLFGNLSPQRVREWLAYHIRMFGPKSHFVLHDAGGVHPGVMEVLKPWMEKGYVTLHDIREQERFDGYYHNQFLIVNDCLHRYRFAAKWMFFFDVDEFIFVPKKSTIKSVMDSLSEFTQFTIEQMPMSNKLCFSENAGKTYRKWGFEKLLYRDSKQGIRRDRKYAVQSRNVIATGVHMSQNTVGKTTHNTEGRIMYYHYHGTISERREPCRQLTNSTEMNVDGIHYVLDTRMTEVAGNVKRFELKMIGDVLQKTRQ